MKSKVLLALIMFTFTGSAVAADVCGSPGEKPSVKAVTVALHEKPSAPAFYYRTDLSHVAFVTESAMTTYLDSLPHFDPSSDSGKLVAAIRADLPLKDYRDLFSYSFENPGIISHLDWLVAEVAERGDVSLVAPGGRQVNEITIVHERKPQITLTRIYAGRKGINEVLAVRGCIAD